MEYLGLFVIYLAGVGVNAYAWKKWNSSFKERLLQFIFYTVFYWCCMYLLP